MDRARPGACPAQCNRTSRRRLLSVHAATSSLLNKEHTMGTTLLSTITPETIKNAFREIMDHEAQHVSFFQTALKRAGATPRPKPTFKGLEHSDIDEFILMSRTLENAGVGAFLMAMPAIRDASATAAAA